eukprot:jgi/Mesvir1/14691/Mv05350-RA.1
MGLSSKRVALDEDKLDKFIETLEDFYPSAGTAQYETLRAAHRSVMWAKLCRRLRMPAFFLTWFACAIYGQDIIRAFILPAAGIAMESPLHAFGEYARVGLKLAAGAFASWVLLTWENLNLFQILRFLTIVASFIATLHIAGFDVRMLLTLSGFFSVVLSIGTQGVVANIMAGAMIMLQKDFDVGDYIRSTDGMFEGTVDFLSLQQIVIRSAEGATIFVPCNNIIKAAVVNESRRHFRRVQEKVTLRWVLAHGIVEPNACKNSGRRFGGWGARRAGYGPEDTDKVEHVCGAIEASLHALPSEKDFTSDAMLVQATLNGITPQGPELLVLVDTNSWVSDATFLKAKSAVLTRVAGAVKEAGAGIVGGS